MTHVKTKTANVFVYGTLKQGHGNHGWLKSSRKLGDAVTVANNFRMGNVGGFPEVTRGGSSRIAGEAYAVDTLTLGGLDRLEGNGSIYQRERIKVRLVTGKISPFNESVNDSRTVGLGDRRGSQTLRDPHVADKLSRPAGNSLRVE